MKRLLLAAALSYSSLSWSADAFPWPDGETILVSKKGTRLSWTLKREGELVRITGTHPEWRVEHEAKPDGTPVRTVKTRAGKTTTLTYTATGAELVQVDSKGGKKTVKIEGKGLWDGDTLDVRLAGLTWGTGKRYEFKIVDIDAASEDALPMRADDEGDTTCGSTPCHHVELGLGDARRIFGPKYHYRYAVAPTARYLQYEGDGQSFEAK